MATQEIDLTKEGLKTNPEMVFKSGSVGFNVEQAKMRLALWVLAGLASLFAGSTLIYAFDNVASAKDIFDFVKVSFPPIVTLILGAYFKSKD